jgi:ankyrin repeat protein
MTDFPGNFPNGPATATALIRAGADVNARFEGGPHRETPLHWAASCDDVAKIQALLDAGADIEADGSVIDGGQGTALADAVAFGQWKAARALVERGAQANLWQAAGLGLMDRVRELAPGGDVDSALWCAAHGGQHEAAEFLLGQGADPRRVGYDNLTPAQAAARGGFHALADWLRAR